MSFDAALNAAQAFSKQYFPHAQAVFWAGSIVRGEGTPSSDLDLVVLSDAPQDAPRRESLVFEGWPVEVFVHTWDSLLMFFEHDFQRRRPSLP